MLTIMFSLNMCLSILFLTLNHPLSMGFTLLIQTILISLMTGNFNNNFWFSYILFLILVGGMLILFMYMTSIASNEKFKFNPKLIIIPMTVMPMSLLIYKTINMKITNNETLMINKTENLQMSLNKFINFPLSLILTFLMIYLLLVLIATVKITDFKKGSIRQMN